MHQMFIRAAVPGYPRSAIIGGLQNESALTDDDSRIGRGEIYIPQKSIGSASLGDPV